MTRFYVCRHYIKWKGHLYKKGELLPEEFTDHDRVRNIYVSRIGKMEVEDKPEQKGLPPLLPDGDVPPPDATDGSLPTNEESAPGPDTPTEDSKKGSIQSGTTFDLSAFATPGAPQ